MQDKCREDNEEGADAGGYGFQRPKNSKQSLVNKRLEKKGDKQGSLA